MAIGDDVTQKTRREKKTSEKRSLEVEDNAAEEKKAKRRSNRESRDYDKLVDREKKLDGDRISREKKDDVEEWFSRKRTAPDLSNTRAGGAYIPPAKLKLLQAKVADKSSEQYQRISWELLKKRIHGHVNKINVGNITAVVGELLQENIVRGKGLFARSVIQAQSFSPSFSHVYAALIAILNSKFPHIGELVLRRLIIQFKRSFKRNDKTTAINATKFIAHLVNQQVAHEVLALEILTVLLENPTDDSVEVAIAFLKECGAKLTEVSPKGINVIFDTLRSILHGGSELDKRIEYMIEVVFQIRKSGFPAAVITELDLVEEEDQITHTVLLDDSQDPENILNVFKFDPDFEKNEEMYDEIKKEIIGEGSDNEDEDEEAAETEGQPTEQSAIFDNTETNLVAFRRTVYLTFQSSLDFQECIHKLMKMQIKPGMEVELCHMVLDCCSQQRTFERFYGLMAERLCRLRKEYQGFFEQIFKDTYETIHRFELTKLRNATKLFAHLLYTDAISWGVLGCIRLNEDDTTSSSRIFIKVLFQELVEFLGVEKLYERIRDPTLQAAFDGLFPRDNPRDTRFAINFFTSIGLGGLTVDLRQHLKSAPKKSLTVPQFPLVPDFSEAPKVKEEIESEKSDSDVSDKPRKRKHEKSHRKEKKSRKEDRSEKSKKKREKERSRSPKRRR